MKIALSTLCEHPGHRTGLSTLFAGWVSASLRQDPKVSWHVFAGPEAEWDIVDPRVTVDRRFPANNRLGLRLFADHLRVGPAARAAGADLLVTVGFVPVRAPLPVMMQLFSLHHLQGAGPGSWYRRWAVRSGVKRASRLVVNSQWTAAGLRRAGLDAGDRLRVSYEGLDAERFHDEVGAADAEAHRLFRLPAEYLLWVSNFYGYKRAELALEAYGALPPALRERFPLVLVGGDWKGGKERARTVARALGLADQVRFLGWVPDPQLPALYRGARAHLLPTREETFGRSVTEAMACGCPCLLQDLPVLREVAGDAADFVDYTQVHFATRALVRLCTDEVHWRRLRAAGLARARLFSFDQLARERGRVAEEMLATAAALP